jgi:hypothetical protein
MNPCRNGGNGYPDNVGSHENIQPRIGNYQKDNEYDENNLVNDPVKIGPSLLQDGRKQRDVCLVNIKNPYVKTEQDASVSRFPNHFRPGIAQPPLTCLKCRQEGNEQYNRCVGGESPEYSAMNILKFVIFGSIGHGQHIYAGSGQPTDPDGRKIGNGHERIIKTGHPGAGPMEQKREQKNLDPHCQTQTDIIGYQCKKVTSHIILIRNVVLTTRTTAGFETAVNI